MYIILKKPINFISKSYEIVFNCLILNKYFVGFHTIVKCKTKKYVLTNKIYLLYCLVCLYFVH